MRSPGHRPRPDRSPEGGEETAEGDGPEDGRHAVFTRTRSCAPASPIGSCCRAPVSGGADAPLPRARVVLARRLPFHAVQHLQLPGARLAPSRRSGALPFAAVASRDFSPQRVRDVTGEGRTTFRLQAGHQEAAVELPAREGEGGEAGEAPEDSVTLGVLVDGLRRRLGGRGSESYETGAVRHQFRQRGRVTFCGTFSL